jgi:hypothetical protein
MRHPLGSVLALSICAVLAGARSFEAIAEWTADAVTYVEDRSQIRTGNGLASWPPCGTSPSPR